MGSAIRGFVGMNGGGKTLAMVETLAIPAWAQGRPVVANFRLDPTAAGFSEDLFVPLRSWRDVPRLESCTLLMDEIQATFPSRESQKMPAELGRILNQLRKPDVTLGWTGPSWARCDKLLREVTQAVTVCRGYLPERRRAGDLWASNRLFAWWTYDGRDFDEFTLSQSERLRPMGRRWYWRPRHQAQHCYSTLDQVELLDHLDEYGQCWRCGGTRRRPACSCAADGRPQTAPAGEDARPTTTANGR